MDGSNIISVVGEFAEDGSIAPVTLELLGIGRELAGGSGKQVAVVIAGPADESVTGNLIAQGADKVYVAESIERKYSPEGYVKMLDALCNQVKPGVLLIGHSPVGLDLAPRIAFDLNVGLVTDSIKVEWSGDKLKCYKQVYGGIAVAVYSFNTSPQIVSIRQRVGTPIARDDSRSGNVEKLDVDFDASAARYNWLEKVEEETTEIRLEDAEVIVAGGRGMGGGEEFKQLYELATVLNCAVGASRPPCDSGWIPSSRQVGITGKIVSPDVYIAFGISGATQHLTGMQDSKSIIAVNTDAEANIFQVADYGVVGDLKEIIPAFTNKLKELR
ncbi:MAG: electron transfer flavoprotein subunit alpha/FixB family protein [Actinobacteria bacterium]|nr:electron transfer flavoprotein subunit alpha/FixB family protein [Actinomycetota bacterium]